MDLDIFVMSPGSGNPGNPLTTGCGSGYMQFVTGPCSRPARDGDFGPTWNQLWPDLGPTLGWLGADFGPTSWRLQSEFRCLLNFTSP